ncbi:Hpt domain-containing protein [Desulfovibrio sp. Huiquan2017]|uniref:Hpt domain-containing protein n=1 Tax=Desulfovibrio sp. Huiquan2017 TaxID=2816861 RepID=UPI001A934ECE|nr:Hpt domain-containing protein [Desulfovibrio sp. Huiquan2017]
MTSTSEGDEGDGRRSAVFDPVMASAEMGLTPEEFALLLPKAAMEIRLRLEGVRRALADGDFPAVALHSHTVKSVGASLGADAVRRAAYELECCARGGGEILCPELLTELERRSDDLLAELDRA